MLGRVWRHGFSFVHLYDKTTWCFGMPMLDEDCIFVQQKERRTVIARTEQSAAAELDEGQALV